MLITQSNSFDYIASFPTMQRLISINSLKSDAFRCISRFCDFYIFDCLHRLPPKEFSMILRFDWSRIFRTSEHFVTIAGSPRSWHIIYGPMVRSAMLITIKKLSRKLVPNWWKNTAMNLTRTSKLLSRANLDFTQLSYLCMTSIVKIINRNRRCTGLNCFSIFLNRWRQIVTSIGTLITILQSRNSLLI